MRFAKIISVLFHPILMPLVGLIIILNSGIYSVDLPEDFKNYLYLMTGLCSLVLPLSFFPVLIYFQYIKEITLGERRERLIPLFFTTICFYAGYYFIARFSPIRIINLFLLASAMIVLLMLIISLFWKISLHSAGIGGITGLIITLSVAYAADMTIFLSAAILISGLLFTARMVLNTHTIVQLAAGYMVGMFTVIGLMLQLMI